MCGRMTQQTDPAEIGRIFGAEVREPELQAELGPRFNVAPTQPIRVVVQRAEGRFVEMHRWGLVPSYASNPAAGARLINARAETVATSPAFRGSFTRRRCLVPAEGFYEWRREGRRRLPFLFYPVDERPLAFAGLWAVWRDPHDGAWLLSCAVVTTRANGLVSALHDRMPVILDDNTARLWLDPEMTDPGLLTDLLQPADDDALLMRPVSPLVNNPNNEGPALLVPPGESASLTLFS
jgi:putative SOS response-associated peptidase YedK